MTEEPLDLLLDRLRNGDEAAAGQIVADYEPYLRLVVRRCLAGSVARQVRLARRGAVGLGPRPARAAGPGLAGGRPRRGCEHCWSRWRDAGSSAATATTAPPSSASSPAATAWKAWPSRESRGPARSPWPTSCGIGCSPSARRSTTTCCACDAKGCSCMRSRRAPGCTRAACRRVLRRLARQLALGREPLAAAGTREGEP